MPLACCSRNPFCTFIAIYDCGLNWSEYRDLYGSQFSSAGASTVSGFVSVVGDTVTFRKGAARPSSGPELIPLRERSRIWVKGETLAADGNPEQLKLGWVKF
jgi:hypothetical protein